MASIPAVLLAAGLLIPAKAFALDPDRRAMIVAFMPQWEQVKAQERRALDHFMAAFKTPKDIADVHILGPRLWSQGLGIESKQRALRDALMRKLDSDSMPDDQRQARKEAAEKLFELRMVYVYGNLLPKSMDESVTDNGGKSIGHVFAGPEWEIFIQDDEQHEMDREFQRDIGYPKDVLKSLSGPPQNP